jgi:hypothetical protein
MKGGTDFRLAPLESPRSGCRKAKEAMRRRAELRVLVCRPANAKSDRGQSQIMGENCRAFLMIFALRWIASREFFESAAEVVCMKISQFVSDFFYCYSLMLQ